ncbi:MAG: hypothetical protein EA378_11765 [Phycisphaerales bacterium]|nr:MAG: hypothetical protein EA378_11765 [Phycisphaerales bacterium]
MRNLALAAAFAIGLALIATALGFLYLDHKAMSQAYVRIMMRDRTLQDSSAEVQAALEVYEDSRHVVPAFITGVAGAACLGFSGVLLALRLPIFQPRPS